MEMNNQGNATPSLDYCDVVVEYVVLNLSV